MMSRMDMYGILSGAVFTVLALMSTAANASLVQKIETLPNSSKLYTIVDDVNHQQWLDGWSTVFMTYNQVTSMFLAGEAFEGYHVATTSDLFGLFSAAGLAGELGYDQWGGLNASYTGAQRDRFESFLHLMGFSIFGPNYFTYDNGDINTFPIVKINSYDPYYGFGELQTVFNMPNSGKDSRIGIGWGVSTLLVKNTASVPEPTGLTLILIALTSLVFIRRFASHK